MALAIFWPASISFSVASATMGAAAIAAAKGSILMEEGLLVFLPRGTAASLSCAMPLQMGTHCGPGTAVDLGEVLSSGAQGQT